MGSTSERETTTVTIHRSTHEQLKKLRQYDSMSFDDLISEMADTYERTTNESHSEDGVSE